MLKALIIIYSIKTYNVAYNQKSYLFQDFE